ncbi:hypothetical protein WJX84_007004 [Apatococcus fuscideae]|uniref:Uncharacterized protein n=1 Tax=Apatococcus fuscideae TaxID=2026836 RepID=A0AAW1T9R5_9CHLO
MAATLYGFGAALFSGVQKVLPRSDRHDLERLTGDLERIDKTLEDLQKRPFARKRPAGVPLASPPKRTQLERSDSRGAALSTANLAAEPQQVQEVGADTATAGCKDNGAQHLPCEPQLGSPCPAATLPQDLLPAPPIPTCMRTPHQQMTTNAANQDQWDAVQPHAPAPAPAAAPCATLQSPSALQVAAEAAEPIAEAEAAEDDMQNAALLPFCAAVPLIDKSTLLLRPGFSSAPGATQAGQVHVTKALGSADHGDDSADKRPASESMITKSFGESLGEPDLMQETGSVGEADEDKQTASPQATNVVPADPSAACSEETEPVPVASPSLKEQGLSMEAAGLSQNTGEAELLTAGPSLKEQETQKQADSLPPGTTNSMPGQLVSLSELMAEVQWDLDAAAASQKEMEFIDKTTPDPINGDAADFSGPSAAAASHVIQLDSSDDDDDCQILDARQVPTNTRKNPEEARLGAQAGASCSWQLLRRRLQYQEMMGGDV